MSETLSCTFADCNRVFTKAYELKKHTATHEDPASVFYCTECDFISLQKKNLVIHLATHTGEKIHLCPDTISYVGSCRYPDREELCDYRTNDPAALTKHRKRVHAYIPPPNRSRPTTAARPVRRKHRRKTDKKVSQRPALASCRKQPHVPCTTDSSSSGAPYTSASTVHSSADSSPLRLQGGVNAYVQPMDADSPGSFERDSSVSSTETLVDGPDEEMELDTLYDPSLHAQWMVKYEMSYSMFSVTGMKHHPEPLQPVPSAPASLDKQIGREGCLCPEWMVEAGIEGWDQSVLETHRDFYEFGV